MGLSLFVCDGDVPVECVAFVSLDDPDFSKKLSAFRAAAENSVGKGFETDIWLPDEQVMFRSLKLEEDEASERRKSASGALSASTPFHGEALCFDLGDTNGAGYTPVAAIPKDKMDEAMAFATKMRMNPGRITTSNVVAGFPERPDFRPYMEEQTTPKATMRMTALAMLLAAPIFMMSSELGTQTEAEQSAGNALVVSIEPTVADTIGDALGPVEISNEPAIEVPAQPFDASSLSMPEALTPQVPASAPTALSSRSPIVTATFVEPVGIITLTARYDEALDFVTPVDLGATIEPVAALSTLPTSNVVAPATVALQTRIEQPALPAVSEDEISISDNDGFRKLDGTVPTPVFESGADKLPDLEGLTIDYVQNVFDGNITIRDLVAVDERAIGSATDQGLSPTFIQVANIGEGILVRRPDARAAPKLVQPAFMPRPEKRPLPLLPEQAFDYNTIVPIDKTDAVEDPPPSVVASAQNDLPMLKRPEALFYVLDKPTVAIMDRADFTAREKAIARARSSNGGILSRLTPPRARSAVPLAGSNGALVQTLSVALATELTIETNMSRPTRLAVPSRAQSPIQLVALGRVQPSLPEGLPRTSPRDEAVADISPYKPGADNPRVDLAALSASRVTVPRPPTRRLSEGTFITVTPPSSVEPAEQTESPAPLEAEAASQTEEPAPITETDEDTTADIEADPSAVIAAAAALPELLLPRPPARPDRSTDVAALIRTLPPAETEPAAPASKFAIPRALSPIKRPAGLESQAKKVIAARSSVANQVAKKQEPARTTPQNQLRIPTGARVGATATIKDAIALSDISLIGIFGTNKTRRALVRLPQGRYIQISRGDRVSGWTVSAVGEDAVRIQKGSKNKVLRLPN